MTVSNDRVALGYAGGAWDGDEAAVARVHVGEVEHHDGKVGVEPAVAAVGQVLVAVLALRGRRRRECAVLRWVWSFRHHFYRV